MAYEPNGNQPPLPGAVYTDLGIDASMDFQRDVRLRLLSIESKLDSLVVKHPSAMKGVHPANRNWSRCDSAESSRQETGFQGAVPSSDKTPSMEFQGVLPLSDKDPSMIKSLTLGSVEKLDRDTKENGTADNTQDHCRQSASIETLASKNEVERAMSCGLARIHIDKTEEDSSWTQRMSECATHKLENLRHSAMQETAQHRSWKCVHSNSFQVMTSVIIVCNAIAIGLNTDAELQAVMTGGQPGSEWAVVDTIFAIIFGAELLARAVAEKWLFFFGVDWMWNLFDTFLVALCVANLALSSEDMSNFSVARIVRFVRFIRLVRLARAVRAVQSLRLFILSVFASGLSFIWSLLIISVIIYFFASIILSGVIEYIRNPQNHDRAGFEEFYGSVWGTMVTLFMCISGGVSWKDPMVPLATVHWIYEPLFTTFIFFMFFGVLNIVVGAFVTATAEISQKDRDFLINAELEAKEAYTRNIKEFFQDADTDMSGKLSWDEFEHHLQNPKVSAYFASFELDVSHAHRLFKLLDLDGSGEVSSDEFLDGCMRLKGDAKSIDVNILVYEVTRMSRQISSLIEYMNGNVNGNRESGYSTMMSGELDIA